MKIKNLLCAGATSIMLLAMTALLSPTFANHHGNEGTTAITSETVTPETITPETITPETIIPETIIPETTIPETTIPEKTKQMVTLHTSAGEIKIALDTEKAPKSVENFLSYATSGHYDGTIFHRVIKGFMIQGGGFEPGMQQKEVNQPIPNEANNGLFNNKYTVAMARTNDPHSATAQFFINSKDNDFLNFSSETSRGWGYAVFGEVVEGKEVVDAIENVATGQTGPHGDVPQEDIVIEKVIINE